MSLSGGTLRSVRKAELLAWIRIGRFQIFALATPMGVQVGREFDLMARLKSQELVCEDKYFVVAPVLERTTIEETKPLAYLLDGAFELA